MPSEDENFEKYDHAEAIRSQIRRVNHVLTEIDTGEEQQSFQMYYSKCFMALSSLEAMISPFRPEDYTSPLEEQNPLGAGRSKQLRFIYETFKEMMNFLYEENLFYAQRHGRTQV